MNGVSTRVEWFISYWLDFKCTIMLTNTIWPGAPWKQVEWDDCSPCHGLSISACFSVVRLSIVTAAVYVSIWKSRGKTSPDKELSGLSAALWVSGLSALHWRGWQLKLRNRKNKSKFDLMSDKNHSRPYLFFPPFISLPHVCVCSRDHDQSLVFWSVLLVRQNILHVCPDAPVVRLIS